MNIDEITKNNIEKYSSIFGDDQADYIGRDGIRALAVENDEHEYKAAMLWKISATPTDETEITAVVTYLDVSDDESADALFSEYRQWCEDDGVRQNTLEVSFNGRDKLVEILEKQGIKVKKAEGYTIKATMEDLKGIKELMASRAEKDYVYPLGDISEDEFNAGLSYCMEHSRRKLKDDLRDISYELFDPLVSCCIVIDGIIEGFLLVRNISEKCVRVELLDEVGEENQEKKQDMIAYSALVALKKYGRDTTIIFECRDQGTKKMTRILFPSLSGEDVLKGHITVY